MRIAVIGAGISGLSCSYFLNQRHDVWLFEAKSRLGGHSHTQHVNIGGAEIAVDTGFIVYNERNYPDLVKLLTQLGVETQSSDMSFGASIDNGAFEYCGSSPSALFAQRKNLLNPRFVRMLADIVRFNKAGTRYLLHATVPRLTLGEFLDRHRFGSYFRRYYLLPMGAAIWSMPVADMLEFPASTFLKFFHNHGLLTVNGHPLWRTLKHRSQDYVGRISASLNQPVISGDPVKSIAKLDGQLTVRLQSGWMERFDHIVLAAHADASREILDKNFVLQRGYLKHFRFQTNDAVLHSDPALMPKHKRAWASWNYLCQNGQSEEPRVSLTYWMNKLQAIDHRYPLFVTLNPVEQPRGELVHHRMSYDHPVFDQAAIDAQQLLSGIQGQDGIWLAGAWLGYGFHEDGARSGLDVAAALGAPPQWQAERAALPLARQVA